MDTVTEYELVLPSGEVKKVTEQDEDLWFALKVSGGNKSGEKISLMFRTPLQGGLNNYVNSQLVGLVMQLKLTTIWC